MINFSYLKYIFRTFFLKKEKENCVLKNIEERKTKDIIKKEKKRFWIPLKIHHFLYYISLVCSLNINPVSASDFTPNNTLSSSSIIRNDTRVTKKLESKRKVRSVKNLEKAKNGLEKVNTVSITEDIIYNSIKSDSRKLRHLENKIKLTRISTLPDIIERSNLIKSIEKNQKLLELNEKQDTSFISSVLSSQKEADRQKEINRLCKDISNSKSVKMAFEKVKKLKKLGYDYQLSKSQIEKLRQYENLIKKQSVLEKKNHENNIDVGLYLRIKEVNSVQKFIDTHPSVIFPKFNSRKLVKMVIKPLSFSKNSRDYSNDRIPFKHILEGKSSNTFKEYIDSIKNSNQLAKWLKNQKINLEQIEDQVENEVKKIRLNENDVAHLPLNVFADIYQDFDKMEQEQKIELMKKKIFQGIQSKKLKDFSNFDFKGEFKKEK